MAVVYFFQATMFTSTAAFPFIRLLSILATMMTIMILLIIKSFLYSRWYRSNQDWPLSDEYKKSLFNVKSPTEPPRFYVNSELKCIHAKNCSKSAFLQKPKQTTVPAFAKISTQTQLADPTEVKSFLSVIVLLLAFTGIYFHFLLLF